MNWNEVKIMSLLQMSFSGGIMILVITVIRMFTVHRLPKKTFLILWSFVLLRLLLPFSIPSPFSAYTLVENQAAFMEVVENTPAVNLLPFSAAQPDAPKYASDSYVSEDAIFSEAPSAVTQETQSTSVWTLLWATGTLICLLYFAVSYRRCFREFQHSLPAKNDLIDHWLDTHNKLKRCISIRQSCCVTTPLTYGLLRPVILLPKNTDCNNTQALEYILTHEYVHIRRLDILTKFIMTVTVCIHWFIPLVWCMFILFNRDIELSCDEAVLSLLGSEQKANYARVLIDMEASKSGLAPLYNGFSKNSMEERITAIMKIKKTSIFAVVSAFCLIAAIVIIFATSSTSNCVAAQLFADENAPTFTVNPAILEYDEITWQQFKKQNKISYSSTYLHANFYSAEIIDTSTNINMITKIIFSASDFDEKLATALLAKNDPAIRVESNLCEIFPKLTEDMSIEDFVQNLTWKNGQTPEYQIKEGAGTAYYIADRYVELTFDSDGDSVNDMALQISLDHSENITPDSYAWLIFNINATASMPVVK